MLPVWIVGNIFCKKKYMYSLFNNLYYLSYPLYKPLYFSYKNISDRKKIAIIRKYLKPGMRVLDIGANIGYYTRLFSKSVGSEGKVYAFEPDNINFEHLKKNVKNFDNVIALHKAVGEETRITKLYHSKEMNVDHQTYDGGENRKVTEIEMISIDQYLAVSEQIDFIKLDIQGYDFFAVKGMQEIIKRSKKVAIFGEFWPYALKKAGIDAEEYIKLLEDIGFDIRIFGLEKEVTFDKYITDKSFYTDFFGIKNR